MQAFYTIWSPGNIPVDANGEPLPGSGPKKNYIVYVETSTPDITWTSASVDSKIYSITPTLIKDTMIDAGMEKNSRKPIIIRSHNGSHLWRLDLIPPANSKNNALAEGQETILIKGVLNGKKLEHSITRLTELYTPEAY